MPRTDEPITARNSLLDAKSPDLWAAVNQVAVTVSLGAGRPLFLKGDAADCFYIVDKGEVEISVMSVGGRKLSLDIITAPEAFGEIGLFAGTRTADATALSDVRLRQVRRNDLMGLIATRPDLALQMIDLLCARLRDVSQKLEERAFLPLQPRLARRLLHLSGKYPAPDQAIPMSQAELADFVGATREAVAKTLAIWRAEGWIDLTRGSLCIRDRAALEVIAATEGD